ncbi:DUF805 domain-containing protein [Demequina aestuarii]|uniref:DUF805 domain-containing protein n=1 Tax=Demequina aestuarii TaxID=327095 RepID=UPI000782116F|nr:DUF805 domain-containing protein [Demequina aestuarii]
MGFGTAIKTCFSKYATFEGRARRAEFWLFYLFTIFVGTVSFGITMVTALTVLPTSELDPDPSGAGLAVYFVVLGIVILVNLALIIPVYAAWARRLHDMGQSGHWLWLNLVSLGIVPLIMAFMDSQQGANRWGADPKAAERGQYGGYGQAQYGQAQPGQAPGGYLPPQPPAPTQ